MVRLGEFLEPSLGRFGCVLEGLEAVFRALEVFLEAPEAIQKRLGASNGGRTKHSILHVVC